MWGEILKRDLLGESREEDKFHSIKELREYIESEIKRQGENVVIRNLDVSLIEDFTCLFAGIDLNIDIKSLDLSGWKTSNVKDMTHLFWFCHKLERLNLSGWDISNVERMDGMFCDCKNLKSLDLSGWKTSNVKSMSEMFCGCENLESLDLSGFDTSNVENISWMFKECKNLKSLDLSGWDTSNVEDMSNTFCDCPAPYEIVDFKIVKK